MIEPQIIDKTVEQNSIEQQDIKQQVEKITLVLKQKLLNILTANDLSVLKSETLGKSSEFNSIISQIKFFSIEDKKIIGSFLQETKRNIENLFIEKQNSFKIIDYNDIYLYKTYQIGERNIISKTIEKVKSIFMQLDFHFFDAPEIDTAFRNFTSLNVGEKHPCRNDHQSFFLNKDDLILRTHTSNIHSYILESDEKSCFTIGRVFRKDLDSTHTPMFHQIECVSINKNSNVRQLFKTIKQFLCAFFDVKNIELRVRPSFFPFTEPSYEVDMLWNNKWLEVLGAGILHPNLFTISNRKPELAYAFGCGLERLAMIKFGLKDIRELYSNNAFVITNIGDQQW